MDTLPDSVILHIFKMLSPKEIAAVGQCCTRLRRISHDDILWRDIFHSYFNILPLFPKPIGKNNWRSEFIRLVDETPFVEAEVIKKHTDQVLHVSFSHDGKRFATCGKDAYIYVWRGNHPVELEFHRQMKKFNWKYTQFSEFNESDSLLLVSGVLFGLHSTSGEIAVFNLTDCFQLQCRIQSKPYDIFGTWYSENYLFSGDLRWLAHLVSKSTIWLNKASQETESEHTAIINKMFSFYNPRASSIRSIMIANCIEDTSVRRESPLSNSVSGPISKEPSARSSNPGSSESRHCDSLRDINSKGLKGTLQGAFQNWRPLDNVADIDYTLEYHNNNMRDKISQQSSTSESSRSKPSVSKSVRKQTWDLDRSDSTEEKRAKMVVPSFDGTDSDNDDDDIDSSMFDDTKDECKSAGTSQNSPPSPSTFSSAFSSRGPTYASSSEQVIDNHDKWLIFTCGSETYTPHQVGFKKIKPFSFQSRIDPGPSIKERREELRRRHQIEQSGQQEYADYSDYSKVAFMFDEIDHVVDLHGHVIGMALSPDHRYLYVNSRPWPAGYRISDPLDPPPIAQEIDIHVIDLATLTQVGMMRRAHRAYTPNEECFFIFLDACDMYLASGSEDKHGYLWDRHYGVSLAKLPHTDVCNSVAFNPADSRMLVSVSDDGTIKIWRSKDQCREFSIDMESKNKGTTLYLKQRRSSCTSAVSCTS